MGFRINKIIHVDNNTIWVEWCVCMALGYKKETKRKFLFRKKWLLSVRFEHWTMNEINRIKLVCIFTVDWMLAVDNQRVFDLSTHWWTWNVLNFTHLLVDALRFCLFSWKLYIFWIRKENKRIEISNVAVQSKMKQRAPTKWKSKRKLRNSGWKTKENGIKMKIHTFLYVSVVYHLDIHVIGFHSHDGYEQYYCNVEDQQAQEWNASPKITA